jgi:serine/threonine-protein kinase
MTSADDRGDVLARGGGQCAQAPDPSVEARAQARVGTSLRGKWRLDALLGVGGMAAVYAATHRNGTRAAVKVLHAELSVVTEARNRFSREGYVANAVAHEGVVRVLDDDVSEDGSLFLVTELLTGETLEQRRVRLGGRLPEGEVLAAIDQLLDVLVAAHAKDVVHRDVKPENLFLTRSGQIKVLDFGIARMRELTTASTATRFGESMGTPAFMPPEQARGRWDEVDATSDLWACGATMFTLLTGEVVNDGPTANEALLAAMTRPAPAIASIAPDVSAPVAVVIDRALAFEKAHRWPSARAMQEGVRQAYVQRNQAPITTAPKLVPPEAPGAGRTEPRPAPRSAEPATEATAAAQAEAARDEAGAGLPGRRRAVVVGGVAAVGLALVVALVLGRASPRSQDTVAPSAGAQVPPVETAVATGAEALSASVALAPEPTPTAAVPAPSGERRAKRGGSVATSPSGAASATAGGKAGANGACTPPFTIDPATGKKHWRPECL